MARYKNDPRWITAKYAGKCIRCSNTTPKGAKLFYYPIGKSVYCAACGEVESAKFEQYALDEEFYNAQY